MDLVTVRPSNAMTISDGIAVSGTKIPKINNCACTLDSPAPAETKGGRNSAKNNTVLGFKSSTQTQHNAHRYYLRCDLTADCLLKALCKPLQKSLGTP